MQYIGIDDDTGRQVWSDVATSVIQWVTLAEHDALIEIGVIDLDGKVLVNLEFSDD